MKEIAKALKGLFRAFMEVISAIFKALERFFAKIELGPKIKKFVSQSGNKIQSGLVNVRQKQQTRQSQASAGSVNVNKLGYFLDGWAELVEGMGEKADEVRKDTLERLELKEMPDIESGELTANAGLSSGKRDYIFSVTYPGATTAIYIAKHGKDLYVSWRTWLAAQLNKLLILIMLGLAVWGGYATFGTRQVGGGLFSYGYTETWALGWIASSIVILLLEIWLVSSASRMVKGNPFTFFFIEPNVFDAEDITAMSLSAHYAILRSLDNAGIDTSKLRIKEKFTGGRRGEDI